MKIAIVEYSTACKEFIAQSILPPHGRGRGRGLQALHRGHLRMMMKAGSDNLMSSSVRGIMKRINSELLRGQTAEQVAEIYFLTAR